MRSHTPKITYLDGIRLYRAIVAGIRQVISQQEHLNNINVYPVPDRDTGTNMALTLNAVLENTYPHNCHDIHDLLENVANAALNGSRGNSGAILAQFFQGLSEGAKSVHKKMTTKNFVAAISTGVNFAHKALSEPKEGTILTILRDFSDEITHRQLENNELDFVDLLSMGVKRAEISLEHTQFQLKEMKKAGVVDAGAQGFVEFLNGIYAFVLTGSIKALLEDIGEIEIKESDEEIYHEIDERFRFCTECLIDQSADKAIDQDELRNTLDELGNSLIVAGSRKKTKIHMHTNDPKKIFEICSQYGNVTAKKADDMINQQKSFAHRDNKVAILTDSGADIPEAILSELNIHVVPIVINFGQETYLDKVSISSEEFHHLIKTHKAHPTTSQPSLGDFHRQYQYLSTHFDSIVALHVPNKLSGTMSASQKAAEKVSGHADIVVLDSLNGAAGQGLIVMRAAEAAKAGYTGKEIATLVKEVIPKTDFYFAISNLTFLARSGRVSEKITTLFNYFKLKPLLHFTHEGKMKLAGIVFGQNNFSRKMLKIAKRKIKFDKEYRVIVTHTDCKKTAQKLEKMIKKEFSQQIEQIFILPLGASLSAHSGPGALGIAIQELMPLKDKAKDATT